MRFINFIKKLFHLDEASKFEAAGVYIGRFSGLTLGHLAVINVMSKSHKNNYLVMVKGEKSSLDKSKNPFPFEIQKKMVSRVLPKNVKLVVSPNAYLPDLIEKLKGESFVVYSGPDRLSSYRALVSKTKEQTGKIVSILDANSMVPRKSYISGTEFRKALKMNDLKAFKKVAPPQLHNMFDELKKYV